MEIARHWRLKEQRYRLIGEICPHCETKIFPPRQICPNCTKVLTPNVEIKITASSNIPVPIA